MKSNCNIVRDLLPLYAEGISSEDSNSFVEGHLKTCEACQAELKKIQKHDNYHEDLEIIQEDKILPLKALGKKWSKRTVKIAAISSLIAVFATVIIGGYLVVLRNRPYLVGTPINMEDIKVITGIEYCEGRYLDQRFFIELEHTGGKPLQVQLERDHILDEDGHEIEVGYTLTLRETVWDLFQTAPNSSTKGVGYAYQEEILPDDYDYTITVVYGDQTIVYSMREEGLFDYQDTVVRLPFQKIGTAENTDIGNADPDELIADAYAYAIEAGRPILTETAGIRRGKAPNRIEVMFPVEYEFGAERNREDNAIFIGVMYTQGDEKKEWIAEENPVCIYEKQD